MSHINARVLIVPGRAVAPTQVRYPLRAALRTTLAIIVGVGVGLPIAWGIAQETLAAYLTPEQVAAVAWTVGLVVAISTTVTRIMAIPVVNDLLTRYLNIGAAPKPAPAPTAPDQPATEEGEGE